MPKIPDELIEDAKKIIPKGCYCYKLDKTKTSQIKRCGLPIIVCPFWQMIDAMPEQENGYCAFLDYGDWMNDESITYLWDQVKECEINLEEELDIDDILEDFTNK